MNLPSTSDIIILSVGIVAFGIALFAIFKVRMLIAAQEKDLKFDTKKPLLKVKFKKDEPIKKKTLESLELQT